MQITLLGTGDAPGTPVIGCTCDTCLDAVPGSKSQRTRFSILIRNEFVNEKGKSVSGRVLIDCSPDIRYQLLREKVSGRHRNDISSKTNSLSKSSRLPVVIDDIVFTHAHYDHFGGLGEFYRVQPSVNIHGVSSTLDSINRFFSYLSPYIKRNDILPYQKFSLTGLNFTLFDVVHQPVPKPVGVIVENDSAKVVITGDCNPDIPKRSLEAIKNPDLFIANAIIPDNETPGPIVKHMNALEAIEISEKINAKKTVLSHLSHYYPPHDKAVKSGYNLGFDGMKFEF